MIQVAFYGRVSTEDQQDPDASKGWQLRRAKQLVEPAGGQIVEEFFDIGASRSLPWKRRAEASRLLDALADTSRGFSAVVVGEPQRAFYGNQFGLTFPVFTHYGVQLWVPEVGGPIDPGSEAHDLVMTLFGGMSKGERTRIQVRTKAAMLDLAARTNRFLGGRPPYGYRLVDAGPHPNPGRAAAGQRAHRLEADPITGPTIQRIFDLYAAGHGLRAIAQLLTDEDVPSPSAHDPLRNTHRDARGWAHSAVRTILKNEVYTGRRVWAKQQKVEQLIDPNNVAAGNRTQFRWRPENEWLKGEQRIHPALVSDDVWDTVRGLMSSPEPPKPKTRASRHTYLLRGILYCGDCGRLMQGAWRKNRADGTKGRTLYRCAMRSTRALPPQLSDHPKSLYVREDLILGRLDEWIGSLITPEALTAGQAHASSDERAVSLRLRITETDNKISALVAALESGVAVEELTSQLAKRSQEKRGLEAQLRQMTEVHRVTAAELELAIKELGGLARILPSADPATRAKLYASLGIRLQYDHDAKQVRATAESACVPGRVRRGT